MDPSVLASAAAAVEVVLAASLAAVAFVGWRRTRDARLLFLPAAFLMFLAQAGLLAGSLLLGTLDLTLAIAWGAALNCGALLAMYLALLRP